MKLDGYVYTPYVRLVFSTRESLVLRKCGGEHMDGLVFSACQSGGLIDCIMQRNRFFEGAPFELSRDQLKLLIKALESPRSHWAADAHGLRTALLAQLVILSDEFLQMNPQPVKG